MATVELTRKETFSASHRLHNASLGDADNQQLYGKCNNRNGHGHNYVWEVTLRGPIDPRTGMVYNLADLKVEMKTVLDLVDHKNLDKDVDYFKNHISSAENLVVYLWALSCISWKLILNLFMSMMILWPLKIFCCKKRKTIVKHRTTPKLPTCSITDTTFTKPSTQPITENTTLTPTIPTSTNETKPAENKPANTEGPQDVEKSIAVRITDAVSNMFKKKQKNDENQPKEAVHSDKEKPDIVPMDKVKKMGNLDEFLKKEKIQLEKEIEAMKSVHEMDDNLPLQPVSDPTLHVKIDENKCKVYETNDEPTLDEEVNEQLI